MEAASQSLDKNNLEKNKRVYKQDHSILYTVIVCSIILYFGWETKEQTTLSPEDGWGYALGIIGGSSMLIVLLYPVRKYVKFFRHLGAVKYWFRIHMFLGVFGPLLVIFHSNFNLGSVNSNIALFSMIIVALSGLIGRFIYVKIHISLYGKQVSIKELRDDLKNARGVLGKDITLSEKVINILKRYEKSMLKHRPFILGVVHLPVNVIYTKWIYSKIIRGIKKGIRARAIEKNWDSTYQREMIHAVEDTLMVYTSTIRKFSELKLYERLFSIWHIVHLPLFIMLIISGIIHVIAVHMY